MTNINFFQQVLNALMIKKNLEKKSIWYIVFSLKIFTKNDKNNRFLFICTYFIYVSDANSVKLSNSAYEYCIFFKLLAQFRVDKKNLQ